MLIKKIRLTGHPVLGNLDLDFTDGTGAPFPTVIFAGGNGCGKTLLLETIHKIFEWSPRPDIGDFDVEIILDANNIEQLQFSKLISVPHPIELLKVQYKREHNDNSDWKIGFYGNGMSSSQDY